MFSGNVHSKRQLRPEYVGGKTMKLRLLILCSLALFRGSSSLGQDGAVATSDITEGVLKIDAVRASTFDPGSAKYPHTPNQAIDGDIHSCWSAESNVTSNQWIEFTLSGSNTISKIRVTNGWIPRGYPAWFKANHRAKTILITFDGTTTQKAILKDTNGPQVIRTEEPVVAHSVRVEILDIYPYEFGADKPSITVSEIELMKE